MKKILFTIIGLILGFCLLIIVSATITHLTNENPHYTLPEYIAFKFGIAGKKIVHLVKPPCARYFEEKQCIAHRRCKWIKPDPNEGCSYDWRGRRVCTMMMNITHCTEK